MGRPAAAIAAEVVMRHSLHKGAFVLVEGPIDSRIYKQFLDTRTCRVVVADGRENVESVVTMLDGRIPGLSGVLDSDFDRIEGRKLDHRGLLVVDTHDLETLLIQSSALDRVLRSMGDPDKTIAFERRTGLTIRDALFQVAEPLGALRLYSKRAKLSLRFENLEFSRFVDMATFTPDRVEMIAEVGRKTRKPSLDVSDLVRNIEAILDEHPARSELCCGHDLVDALALSLRRSVAHHNAGDVRSDDLALKLGYAFDRHEWVNTSIYAAMKSWELSNAPYTLLL